MEKSSAIIRLSLCLLLLAWVSPITPGVVQAGASGNILKNGGFEDFLVKPWGTGLYSEGRPLWWNGGGCQSEIRLDEVVKKSGLVSLYIFNPTPRNPNVYGTTAQRVAVKPNGRYRITLWAKGRNLASAGAIQFSVDSSWKIRPVSLPAGSFSWRKFDGIFTVPENYIDFRIISQDQGEAWIDDIELVLLDGYFSGKG